ncbi:MAG: P-loop NTPase [Anaerolineales bacterium]|nr:P-loop NTPase [Anaerolineales bacterium]
MANVMEEKTLIGKRIGIFGKGGSGKSTLAVLLTRALRDQGYHVCLLDADSTNMGLAQALGFDRSPEPLLGYFGGMVFSGGAVTCPVDDPTPLPGADISIDSLPSKYFVQGDEITLLLAGKIGSQGPGAGCDGPVSKIARDLRGHIKESPVVTLVDFKAGFEDSARGAITSLDWAVVVVDPTLAAIEMASDMRDMVVRMKAKELPATMHLESPELVALANRIFIEAKIKGVLCVMNRVQNADMENYLRMELTQRSIHPIGVIHDDLSMSIAWLKGMPLDGKKAKQEASRIAKALEAAEVLIGEKDVSF